MSSTTLDPIVKFNLQLHLINMRHPENASVLKIGQTEQLAVATKISSSKQVSKCFWGREPEYYPELPKRNYLVVCVDRWLCVEVFAIYSLEQMKQMKAKEDFDSGYIQSIDWRVLELPEELEADLLNGVGFEDSIIVSKAQVLP